MQQSYFPKSGKVAAAMAIVAGSAFITLPAYAPPGGKTKVASDVQCATPCVDTSEIQGTIDANKLDPNVMVSGEGVLALTNDAGYVTPDTDSDTLRDLALTCFDTDFARFNGATLTWECAPDQTGADGDPFVVKDALGQTVGTLVSHDEIRADVILRFNGVITQLIVRKNQFFGSDPVFFDQDLCEGNAFFDLPAQELISTITGFEKGNIYASSLPPSIVNTTVLSISNNDECRSVNITNDFIEAQDIGQPNFTPPFHVE